MATAPSFVSSDEQELLRATVRDLVTDRAGFDRVREVMLTPEGVDAGLWAALGELGLTALTIPEEHGGAGAGHLEVSIVAEELGRRLAPVPFLSSVVLGTTALLAAGTAEQCAGVLPTIATGERRLALAHLDATGEPAGEPGVRAVREPAGWVLSGTAGYVIDGHTADVVVTAAVTDDGLELFLVAAEAPGLQRRRLEVLDLTRPLATLEYDGVRIEEEARLTGGDAATALEEAVTAAAVVLACEQLGGAEQVLDMTTAYAKERIQFGRAIGSFQAVKHRLAELLVQVEAARSAAWHAARALDAGDQDELAIAAPLAASFCGEVYERAAGDAIQLHGGIAFTWEHDAHLFLKRAKSSKLLLGDPRHHRRRLGDVLGL